MKRLAYAILLSLLWQFSCEAQILTPASQTGNPVNTSSIEHGVDSVNTMGLGLHIEIPLFSVKERGRTLTYSYVYNSPTYDIMFFPTPTQQNSAAGQWAVEVPGSGGRPAGPDNWLLVRPDSWYFMYDTQQYDTRGDQLVCNYKVDGTSESVNYEIQSNFRLVDPEGTQHPLSMTATQYEGATPVGTTCGPANALASPTLDGSGAYVDVQTAAAFWLKDGTKYTLSAFTGAFAPPHVTKSEDPNGNLPTGDMMNRSGLTVLSSNTNETVYQYTDSNGSPQTITVNFSSIAVTTNDCDLAEYASATNPCTDASGVATRLPTSIVLPNGDQYTFTYNSPGTHGELSSMTLPTGATITYTYQRIFSKGTMSARGGVGVVRYGVLNRSEAGSGQTNLWTYSSTEGTTSSNTFTTTVEDPSKNCAVHSYAPVSGPSSPVEQSVTYQNGCGASAPTAQTVATTYVGDTAAMMGQTYGVWNIRPTVQTTTLENGQSSQVQTDYETFTFGSGSPGTWMNPTEVREYDYGATTPTRKTDYTYLHNVGSSTETASQYQSRHIVNRVQSKTVASPSGGLLSTTYDYDNYGSGITASGVVDRDAGYGNWGNITSTTVKDLVSSKSYTTAYTYEDSGQILLVTDPRNFSTKYSYTDTWSNATCALTSSQQGHIYLTSITNALQQASSYSYNSCTGTIASIKDSNSRTKQLSYDLLGRTTQIGLPDGGSTTYCYNDQAGHCTSSSPRHALDLTTQMTYTLSSKQEIQFDGLGRKTRTVLESDASGVDNVDTAYDGLGRVLSMSNPYRSTSDATYGTTTYGYDALGRKRTQTQPDGPVQSWFYVGNVVTFTDEVGNQWQRTTDALGRLAKVLEPSGASQTPSMETDYQYDALNNLTRVDQWGGASGSSGDRVRTFTYDALSRLITATNPETGTVCYGKWSGGGVGQGTCQNGYDANSNLAYKTDAMGAVTNQRFDALNRLISQTYSSGDPAKTFTYDQAGTNTIGRLTYESSAAGTLLLAAHSISAYDPMGRITAEATCTVTTCGSGTTPTYLYSLTYGYDLAGNLASSFAGLPNEPTLNYSYDSAGHLQQITSNWSNSTTYPQTLFLANSTASANPAYSPFGTLANAQLSTFAGSSTPNIVLKRTYDNRGRSLAESYTGTGSATLYSYNLGAISNGKRGYDLVGNVTGFQDAVLGEWNYGYDHLTRMTTASGVSGSFDGVNVATATQGWTYDSFGNRLTQTGSGQTPTEWANYNAFNQITSSNADPAGPVYDLNGRLRYDGNKSYLWEAQGWLCGVTTAAGNHYQYFYDAEGHRVTSASRPDASCGFGTTTLADFVYDQAGRQTVEIDANLRWKHTNVYANGELLATYDPAGLHYALPDWLGDKRVQASAKGVAEMDCWNLPYNELYGCSGTDATEHRYTGKEHDPYTSLDLFGAREYTNFSGRFLSPDWSTKPEDVPYADLEDPQSLNLYSYVKNNPLSHVDKDGHCLEDACIVEGAVAAAFAIRATATYLSSPAGQQALHAGAQLFQGGVQAISGLFHSSDQSSAASPAPAAVAQPGQKDADFVVTPAGTAVATDPGRVRDSLANAPGVTTTPVTGPSGETGTIQTGVKTPNGPVDVRTMDGSSSHGPRTVITHPGTNSPKTPDGKATNDKNNNHIPNDHDRPQ